MSSPPVMSGPIPEGGAIELLRELEARRITGTLRVACDGRRIEIAFVGGQIAAEQQTGVNGVDPVDALLSATEGDYEVEQRLPPLSVSHGDDQEKRGSLAVHVPADLMRYCEHAGLTGALELTHEGRRAEAVYDGGELVAITLDGQDADLHVVFGWGQGLFRVRLDPEAPARLRAAADADAEAAAASEPEPEDAPTAKLDRPLRGESTRQFLRVVEMALADVTRESEKARSPARSSPPALPTPPARPRPESVPPPKARADEGTVRVIFLSGDAPAIAPRASSTRHVGRGADTEESLPDARPERRSDTLEAEPDPMAKKKKNAKRAPSGESEKVTEREEAEAAAAEREADDAAEREAEAADESAAEEAVAEEHEDRASEPPKKAAPAVRSEPTAKPAVAEPPPASPLSALGWAAAVFVLNLGILAFLAFLPPLGCPPGQESCGWGTGCVQLSNDPEHCGACGEVCAAPRECRMGTCRAPE